MEPAPRSNSDGDARRLGCPEHSRVGKGMDDGVVFPSPQCSRSLPGVMGAFLGPYHHFPDAVGAGGHRYRVRPNEKVHLNAGVLIQQGGHQGQGTDEVAERIGSGQQYTSGRGWRPVQHPQTRMLAPGGPSASPRNGPARSAIPESALEQGGFGPLGHHLDARHCHRAAAARLKLTVGPDGAEALDLVEVAGHGGIAMVLHDTRDPLHFSFAVEHHGFVDVALPVSCAIGPQADFAVGMPAAVVHPLVNITRQPIDLPDAPRSGFQADGAVDKRADRVG